MNTPTTILTGDRPTGPLHLGHYVGSCASAALQQTHNQFVLIADLQGLTDNGSNPQKFATTSLKCRPTISPPVSTSNLTTICCSLPCPPSPS